MSRRPRTAALLAGDRFRHFKHRGVGRVAGLYEVLHPGAQDTRDPHDDLRRVVVYRAVADGRVYVRDQDEFLGVVTRDGYDGPRFLPVPPLPSLRWLLSRLGRYVPSRAVARWTARENETVRRWATAALVGADGRRTVVRPRCVARDGWRPGDAERPLRRAPAP